MTKSLLKQVEEAKGYFEISNYDETIMRESFPHTPFVSVHSGLLVKIGMGIWYRFSLRIEKDRYMGEKNPENITIDISTNQLNTLFFQIKERIMFISDILDLNKYWLIKQIEKMEEKYDTILEIFLKQYYADPKHQPYPRD